MIIPIKFLFKEQRQKPSNTYYTFTIEMKEKMIYNNKFPMFLEKGNTYIRTSERKVNERPILVVMIVFLTKY